MNNHIKAKHPSGTSAGKSEEGQRTVVKLSKESIKIHITQAIHVPW